MKYHYNRHYDLIGCMGKHCVNLTNLYQLKEIIKTIDSRIK